MSSSPATQLLQLLMSAARSPAGRAAGRAAVAVVAGALWRARELPVAHVQQFRILHAAPPLHGGSVFADAFRVRA
jgi:hypothetical protein